MKRNVCLVCTTLTAIVWLFSCNEKQDTAHDHKFEELRAYTNQLQKVLRLPALGIAVVSGEDIYYHTSGLSDTNSNQPVTDTTKFFTGNISELITATAVCRLASIGSIALNDPIVKHLPYFKLKQESCKEILITHMLTQTSGIPKHTATWDLPYNGPDALEGITRSIVEQEHEFAAGSKVLRSAYHYDILADLVEKKTGKTYQEFLKEEVFTKLGMTSAHIVADSSDLIGCVKPHQISNWYNYEREQKEFYPYNGEHVGSIGFHASAKDMALWMNALIDNRNFLDDDIYEMLMSPQVNTGEHTAMGFGWEVSKGEETVLFKNYSMSGFAGSIIVIPERKLAVCVLTNSDEGIQPSKVAGDILSWLKGNELKPVKTPLSIALGERLQATHNIDSVIQFYNELKLSENQVYELDEASLGEFGLNLLHRLQLHAEAMRIFEIAAKEFPASPYSHINLAEAFLLTGDLTNAEKHLDIAKGMTKDVDAGAHIIYLAEAINVKKEKSSYGPTDFVQQME